MGKLRLPENIESYGTLCLVCGYDLGEPAWQGDVPSGKTCSSCGVTFKLFKPDWSLKIFYYQWRDGWIANRMRWCGKKLAPKDWDPVIQLKKVGLDLGVSYKEWEAEHPTTSLSNVPVIFEVIKGKIEKLERPLAAFQVLWDGDTQGWHLNLWAVTKISDNASVEKPSYSEHYLYGFEQRDIDTINMAVKGLIYKDEYNISLIATKIGEILAEYYKVPFYFPSPDAPDDDCPVWWEQDKYYNCSRCGKPIKEVFNSNGYCWPCSREVKYE